MMLSTILPAITFLIICITMWLLGRLLIGAGRNQQKDTNSTAVRLMFGPFTFALASVIPKGRNRANLVKLELKQAGYYQPLAPQQFFALRNSLVLGSALLTAVAFVAVESPHDNLAIQVALVGFIIVLICYSVPRLILQSMGKARLQRIQKGLPDALDMITMCMTGGLALQQSLERVSIELRESHADLAFELDIIRRQADALTLENALKQFSQRFDDPEIRSLAALVSQTARLGTNVASALKDFADGIRRSHRQRAEERGNKTSVKLLLPVALCLAPPVYILLLAPAVLELRGFLIRENRPGGILAPVEPGGNSGNISSLSAALDEATQ